MKYSETSATYFIYDQLEDIEETLWYQQEELEVIGNIYDNIGNIYDNPELLEKEGK